MTRICIFGDSVSWGSDDLKKGGWVDRFKIYFKKTGKFNEVFNLGNPGRETTRLLNYIDNECKARLGARYKKDNIIIIQIGINDACLVKNKKPRTSPEQFRQNIQKLIDITEKYVNKVVFIGILPVDESKVNPLYWNVDAYYKNNEIKKYNQIIKSVCKEKKAYFIETYNDWIKIDYKKLLHDGLHPNTEGHQKIYDAVIRFLNKNKII